MAIQICNPTRVTGSRDRSTAVVGGSSPYAPDLVGIVELEELPIDLYGSKRASALKAVDRRHGDNTLIVAGLSNDASYAEVLYETFGPRVIGLQISRHGDGLEADRRPVKDRAMLIYTIGRSYLLEQYQSALQSGTVRIVDGPMAKRAYDHWCGYGSEWPSIFDLSDRALTVRDRDRGNRRSDDPPSGPHL